MEKRKILRQSSCANCYYGSYESGEYRKMRCDKLKELVQKDNACYCEGFVPIFKENSDQVSYLGYKYRSFMGEDYRTEKQWEKAGYKVKEGVTGTKMHASLLVSKVYVYFTKDEVELIRKDK